MIVGRIAKCARTLLVLLVIVIVCSLALGMGMQPATDSVVPGAPAVEADSTPSVTCIPLGLYGNITTSPLVGRLSSSGDNLTFVGTTNGLYVVAPGGKLQHFLYSPFGIKHMALTNDITGDGIREVVVALDDTQVPALRCYNGATWEKVWQFAPMARIWEKLWVDRQLIITNLEVTEDGDSQSLLITSGRCVFSVNAEDGTEQWRFSASSALWRMVALADLNGDGAEEAFVGSDDGHLFWLNARTGKTLWQTKLPDYTDRATDYVETQRLMSDIITLDEESGKVVVASTDGWVHMYDLREKRREWEVLAFETDPNDYSPSDYELMSPTADITGDGLAEVLLSETRDSDRYSGHMTNGKMALCDSAGNIVWRKGTSDRDASVWPGMPFETTIFEGKPVYLDRSESEPWAIRLIDLKDGESVLHTVPLNALGSFSMFLMQPGGTGYLTFSSAGDLTAISAKGDLLWYYPRITNIKAEDGSFVGDGTEDVLFWGESNSLQSSADSPIYPIDSTVTSIGGSSVRTTEIGGPGYSPQAQNPEVRLLKMMDGATRATTWSYEVPYGEFKSIGGLKGIQVAPDLVGADGIRDVIGYRDDTVFVFSGKNGSLTTFSAGQAIASLDVIRNGASGNAIAVGVAGGLMTFDGAGTQLWTTASAGWVGDGTGGFMMLDDINSDNISDLAVTSAAKIVVLKSVPATDNYQLHLTFNADADYFISQTEVVPDADKDGVRDFAYIQRAQAKPEGGQTPYPQLSEKSLVNGKDLFRAQLPVSWFACDLACGDFNGDGYQDSLFTSHSSGMEMNITFISGKDGATLRTHTLPPDPNAGYSATSKIPAVKVGDVDNDGADDLAYGFPPRGRAEYFSDGYSYSPSMKQQLGLYVYSVAKDSLLRSIPTTLLLTTGYSSRQYAIVAADVDGDGQSKVCAGAFEPSMSSRDQYVYVDYPGSGSPQYLALVDVASGRRLAGFTGFDISTMSLFESHQPGILGVAGCGGVCFLHTSSNLQVTSPDDGARTGPTLRVKWDGPTNGDFSQVFVDGVRNDITNGLGSDLALARGNHAIVVWSVDDCGRISYSPSDLSAPLAIKVSPSPWKPVWLVLTLFVLLAIGLALFYARLQRTWRARKRAAK